MIFARHIILLGITLVLGNLTSQAQSFDQLTRPMVTLTDHAVIEQILTDLLILMPDTLVSVNLVDVTANGYGPDDLLILNPTGNVHHLDEYIPVSLQALIAEWKFDADYRYEALLSETPEALLAAHTTQDAPDAIAGMCVDAISQHYAGGDINLLISQDSETVRLEMWGYDPEALQYGGAGESIACEINRQKFEFARPIVVTAFRDGNTCVEAWGDEGQIQTRPCPN
ncbi:MAG: hypothetical protein F4246_03380 [Rhodothermaceae bacterium]|nr:hypothetical protein [Rhodothermaceae bacterium]MXX59274.1 hypothetical protein [Rhodothermaceae bacterium]MYD19830.1 hypothetical protein [Rhodothermaceae bacterium]MYD56039.1 hypothetical protein [Rhodothermaceae bacterium]